MFWTNIKRVSRLGFVNFWRNASVSIASVLIMTIALLVISSLLFSRAILSSTLSTLQEKVDINVYFVTSASEDEITALKQRVDSIPEVSSSIYSSADEELEKFKLRHQDDELTLQALDEVGENPFGATLNIIAKDPSQYESIADFLEKQKSQSASSIIDKVNYSRNKTAIDSLSRMIDASRRLGIAIAVFFALISILITFNTIRLTIYMARDEIAVMKLVGASNRYIKGPFVVGGIMYGVISSFIALFLLIPLTYWAGPYTERLGTGVNVASYYLSNFFSVFGSILLAGVFIGALSSYLAVKKYLKV